MSALKTTCPPESLLSDFGLGKLDAAGAETISQHIETCADCRQRVAGISGDTFVGRLRQAGGAAQPAARRERTYVPGESLANAANSTDGSSAREDGVPRPSRSVGDGEKRDGLGSPSSVSAPPELAKHPDYELIKELGQGGMGTVYLAKNRMMDRMEVLKVISTALLSRPGALERFQQEIRSAAKLAHPNIVAAYSVLRPGDLLVFAMEYVRGQDLSEVVKQRGPLPVANAAFYIHQVANGLQHAFEKGMVHRDIKPNNLMLAIEGKKHVVKILDFGLAKATSEKGEQTGLTKSGQMLGTPDYVAPEQTLDAHKADIRADIYSLGCTLYFLLSGGPPFQETSLFEILKAHHERDPNPLNLVRPDVPVELATIVGKMMAKDPTKRYQTPAEVAKALVPFFKPGQSVATPAPADTAQSQAADETTAHATPIVPIAPPSVAFPAPVSPPAVAVAAPTPLPVTAAAEPLSVSIDTHRPNVRRRGRWSSLPPWQRWAVAGGCAAALLLGIVLLVRTPNGTIEIALSDPNANVSLAVDGDRVDIAGLDEPLSLELGPHELTVKGADYETVTKQFKVTRGKNAPLTVTLVPSKPAGGPPTAVESRKIEIAGTSAAARDAAGAPNDGVGPPLDAEPARPGREARVARTYPPATPADNGAGGTPPMKADLDTAASGPIDLLTRIDPKQNAVAGNWQLVDGVLIAPVARYARLEIPYAAPREYRLTAVVECAQHTNSLALGLTMADSQFMLVIDGRRKNVSGLILVDGQDARVNPTTSKRESFLNDGRPNTIVCTVRKRRIQVTCNGALLVDWKADPQRLSLPTEWEVRDRRRLFVGSVSTSYRFTHLEVVPFGEFERQPAPAREAIAQASETIADRFGPQTAQAKTAPEMILLCEELVDDSLSEMSAAPRYALLDLARALAVSAGAPATALNVIDEMADRFDLDPLALKLDTLAEATKSGKNQPSTEDPFDCALQLIAAACAADRFTDAKRALDIARPVAKRNAKDAGLGKQLIEQTREINQQGKAYLAIQDDLDKLTANPDDPDANLAVGRYRCFFKDDWRNGLKQLAKGSHPALKDLAERDLDQPTVGDEQRALADGYWELSQKEKPPIKKALAYRARQWYRRSLPLAGDPAIESRLQQIDREGSGGKSQFLSELPEQNVVVRMHLEGFGKGRKPPAGRPLSAGGRPSPHGLFMHPFADGFASVTYDLGRRARTLNAHVGLDHPKAGRTPLVFQVFGDGELLWTSPPMRTPGEFTSCEAPLDNVRILELRVNCPGDDNSAHAIWVEPRITWK
ncbi:MAG TPA: protein kinase [Pirellulales bacterium]|nr:protein kinase [Pirellulales bacterium]